MPAHYTLAYGIGLESGFLSCSVGHVLPESCGLSAGLPTHTRIVSDGADPDGEKVIASEKAGHIHVQQIVESLHFFLPNT